jgi:hypothetical protein
VANPPIVIPPFNNVPAPGSAIASAWAQQLTNYAIAKLDKTGGTMTGVLRMGGVSSSDQAGMDISPSGAINTTLSSGGGSSAANPSLTLNRFGVPGPADVGGVFVSFRRGQANQTGSITIGAGGTSTLFNTTSDERLKDVLGDVADPLGRVLELRPVRFAWKETGAEQDGFLALEVAEVAPHAVTGERGAVDDDGNIVPQQLDVSQLVPLLVAAVQTLAARVAELEASP